MARFIRKGNGQFAGSRPRPVVPASTMVSLPVFVPTTAPSDGGYEQAYAAFAQQAPSAGAARGRRLDRTWAGAFEAGYEPDDLHDFFGHVHERTGVRVACVWPEVNTSGVSGTPEWMAVRPGGRVFALAGNLRDWACLPANDPSRPRSPGSVKSWIGDEVGSVERWVPVDAWNYARKALAA